MLQRELNRVEDLLSQTRAEKDELGIKLNALSEKVGAATLSSAFNVCRRLSYPLVSPLLTLYFSSTYPSRAPLPTVLCPINTLLMQLLIISAS